MQVRRLSKEEDDTGLDVAGCGEHALSPLHVEAFGCKEADVCRPRVLCVRRQSESVGAELRNCFVSSSAFTWQHTKPHVTALLLGNRCATASAKPSFVLPPSNCLAVQIPARGQDLLLALWIEDMFRNYCDSKHRRETSPRYMPLTFAASLLTKEVRQRRRSRDPRD